MFSVVILTLNEEHNLPRCLDSLRGIDDVVVLDSGSTDSTRQIARDRGARVLERPFDDFAGQRNYAQREISFRHRWVFHLDADEQMTPELVAECAGASTRDDVDGFFVAPKMIYRGRWIPRCTDFPAYQARFVRAPEFSFVQVGHGQREAPGQRLAWLRESYLHQLSDGADAEWLQKHRRYAREEAEAILRSSKQISRHSLRSADGLERRRALKELSRVLPFRGTARFIYQYLLRGGFVEGQAGFQYCRLLARYENLTAAELRRLKAH